MTDGNQYCTFTVGSLFLGIDVRKVQEVIRYQEMTRVPLAAKVVTGLINLRGQIVPAIDLRPRLGLPPRAAGALPINVVVRNSEGAVSLLVDEIGDVVSVEADSFEPRPETLRGPSRELIEGVFKLKKRLLLILDVDRSVDVTQLAA
ncbi:chemotaxis protein CheW [Humisphaera borealis]|uniref:Purine-binding chemotaxis protein CheW n=1 Tax=Humisphaera borealis TaxID=2807512 RepID=A0A7M2WUB0_9BACT|nr:chemotaxis protein CheW [Humisphaera borealis]QOV88120.1 purine-binding chemotaxis protein CheW [Humisphaera borealis]